MDISQVAQSAANRIMDRVELDRCIPKDSLAEEIARAIRESDATGMPQYFAFIPYPENSQWHASHTKSAKT